MNNLIYSTQKPEDVAPKIEEILRKDLGLPNTMPYSIEQSGVKTGAVASIAEDAASLFFGGGTNVLYQIKFDLTSPRAASVIFNVTRHGLACFAGPIIFSTTLRKAVSSEVWLGNPGIFGSAKFNGEADVCARLNENKNLRKVADKFARVKGNIGGDMRIQRYFKIMPVVSGSDFVVITLPHLTGLTSATTDGKIFFTLADMLEEAL